MTGGHDAAQGGNLARLVREGLVRPRPTRPPPALFSSEPVTEPTTPRMQTLAGGDGDMLVWWGSQVECMSARTRLERAAALDRKGMTLACDRLKQLADWWHEIEPNEIVRESAGRFLRVHALRVANALKLAAALTAAERRPASLRVVTLDERLADAARKEGVALVDIGSV